MAPIQHPLIPEGAKGLVFDADGTLLNSMEYHYTAWKATCDHFGLNISPAMVVELAGKPLHELFDIICERSNMTGQVDHDAFCSYRSAWYEQHPHKATLIEPVAEILRSGHAMGLKLAVASGGSRQHVTQGLKDTGILDWFQAVVTGEDVKHGKPRPDCFLRAAELIGVEPSLCVGYEDAKLGMEAIRNAGFMAAVDVTVFEGYPHLV